MFKFSPLEPNPKTFVLINTIAIISMMEEDIKTIKQWLGTGSINIFGRPFAGKDTQGRIIADLLGGSLVAGGDILRSYHDQDKIQKVMAAGGLIPSDFYLSVLIPYLSRPEFEDKPLILSAVGRLQGEESVIMEATTRSGHPIKAIVLMNLSEEDVWRRFEEAKLKHDRGERTDDHREVLKNRLQKFQDKTMPVIEFYRQNDLLVEVDGMLELEEVTEQIIQRLAQRAK